MEPTQQDFVTPIYSWSLGYMLTNPGCWTDKQTVGMFPWQPPKLRFFSINPIIPKKTLFIMFLNQSKKC